MPQTSDYKIRSKIQFFSLCLDTKFADKRVIIFRIHKTKMYNIYETQYYCDQGNNFEPKQGNIFFLKIHICMCNLSKDLNNKCLYKQIYLFTGSFFSPIWCILIAHARFQCFYCVHHRTHLVNAVISVSIFRAVFAVFAAFRTAHHPHRLPCLPVLCLSTILLVHWRVAV